MEKFIQRITPEYARKLLLQKDSFLNDFTNDTLVRIDSMIKTSVYDIGVKCHMDFGPFFKSAISEIPKELLKVLTYTGSKIIDNDTSRWYLKRFYNPELVGTYREKQNEADRKRDETFDALSKDHGIYATTLYRKITEERYVTFTGEQLSAAIEIGVDFRKIKMVSLLNGPSCLFGGFMNRFFPPVIGYLKKNPKKTSRGISKNSTIAKYGFAQFDMSSFQSINLVDFYPTVRGEEEIYSSDFAMRNCLSRTLWENKTLSIPLSGPKKSDKIAFVLFNYKEIVSELERCISYVEKAPKVIMTKAQVFEKYGVTVVD